MDRQPPAGQGASASVDRGPGSAAPRYNLGVDLTTRHVHSGRGARVALYWENSSGQAAQLTYAQLDERSNRWAGALARHGVARGDRVLLRLPNLPEFYAAALGIAKLGAVFIPSSTQYRAAEIEYRLRDAGAKAVITVSYLGGEVDQALGQLGQRLPVFSFAYGGPPLAPGHLDVPEELAASSASFEPADTAADDVAFLAYTSGTTGNPKGVVHLHRYPRSYETLIDLWHDYRPGDIVACPAEVGWMLPVASTFLYALERGLSVVLYHPLDGRFSAEAWLALIERYQISNFVGTPTIYRMLTHAEHIDRPRLASLRHGVSAGEPLPPDTLAAVERRLGFTPRDGIGMSECMVYCFNRADEEVVPGSCGRPAPGVEIRLLDDELREVPTGSPGVLCVRRDTHPGMMREYWNKPSQTAEVFRGPWYWSGDVLVADAQGRFWFQGRNDDVIKASGYRISPFEVESCLAEHPAVLEAAAVEAPDAVRGHVVKACVVLRAGHEPGDSLANELQAWVRQRLAPYKYPRIVEFLPELPKTQSGKVLRRLLREAARLGTGDE